MKLKSGSKEKKDAEDKAKSSKCTKQQSAIENKNSRDEINLNNNSISSNGIETKKKFETINRELNEKFKLNCMSSNNNNNNNKQADGSNKDNSNIAKILLKHELAKQMNPRRAADINELDLYNNSIDFDCDYDYDFDDDDDNNSDQRRPPNLDR